MVKYAQYTNSRRPHHTAVPLGCVVVMASRLCSSVTPNTALLEEVAGKGRRKEEDLSVNV